MADSIFDRLKALEASQREILASHRKLLTLLGMDQEQSKQPPKSTQPVRHKQVVSKATKAAATRLPRGGADKAIERRLKKSPATVAQIVKGTDLLENTARAALDRLQTAKKVSLKDSVWTWKAE